MQKKQERTIFASWIVPLGILVVTIFIMLLNFSAQSKKEAKRLVEDRMSSVAKEYSAEVRFSVLSARDTQLAMGKALSAMNSDISDELPALLSGLTAGDNFYLAAYCDTEGIAVLSTGLHFDLSQVSYFHTLLENEREFIFTPDDGITGTSAMVSICHITTYNGEGYLLTYLNPDVLESIVNTTEFDSRTFYLLVNTDGQVAAAYGKTDDTDFIQTDSFWDSLQDAVVGSVTLDTVMKRLSNQTTGSFQVSRDGDSRTLYYEPILADGWYWVMGVNQNYVNNQESRAWQNGSNMITRLFIIVFLFLGVIAVINIITKIKANERNKELENKADTDLLTELSNKVATERKIKEYLEANPTKQAILFVLDIDNFKKINDTMGHAFGDEVLRTLGHRLRAEFRVTDIIGRTGGDEFMILLKDIPDTKTVQREGEKVERFFRSFEAGGYVKYAATASIGAAIFPTDAKEFETLYKAADRALYLAKKRGKNQLAFYTETEAPVPVSQ
jgi:diguanylate cyclase (GGDEF)-like protein